MVDNYTYKAKKIIETIVPRFDEPNNLEYKNLVRFIEKDLSWTHFDRLKAFISKKIPKFKITNVEEMIAFIKAKDRDNLYGRNNVIDDRNLKNWLKGRAVFDNRSIMFALAFLLEFNEADTQEFFEKVCLDRAINHRDYKELIYYYCLKNNASWQQANELIGLVSTNVVKDEMKKYTRAIFFETQTIENAEGLIEYINENINEFSYNTSIKSCESAKKYLINDLIPEIKKLETEYRDECEKDRIETLRRQGYKGTETNLPIEFKMINRNDLLYNTTENSNETMYRLLISLHKNKNDVSSELRSKVINGSSIPDEIKSSFPDAKMFSDENIKKAGPESLRKMIILLRSYIYWQKCDSNTEEYIYIINSVLNEFKLPEIYVGNPYDWLFVFCSSTDCPIDDFKQILNVYISEKEFMSIKK